MAVVSKWCVYTNSTLSLVIKPAMLYIPCSVVYCTVSFGKHIDLVLVVRLDYCKRNYCGASGLEK